ncbi:hypothetical protein AZE42_08461, partial [Rhizopogon vesiculosus]
CLFASQPEIVETFTDSVYVPCQITLRGDESLVWTAVSPACSIFRHLVWRSLIRIVSQTLSCSPSATQLSISLVTVATRSKRRSWSPLPPFLSASQLLLTLVIALVSSLRSSLLPSSSLVSDSSSNPTSDKLSSPSSHPILRSLTPSLTKVDCIFDHPLEVLPDPHLILNNGKPAREDSPYGAVECIFMPIYLLTSQNTTDVSLDALVGLIYRMHRFRTCASSIKGLTADI